MALSIFFSLAVFVVIKRADGLVPMGPLEYLGKQPLRYWILMWVLVLIPIAAYVLATVSYFPLHFSWQAAVAISLGAMVFLYGVSMAIDKAVEYARDRKTVA